MIKQYIVDAFTDELFHGNPAAVCLLEAFPEDKLLLNIAKENNLSETAFIVKKEENHYDLRWFTPGGEIDLCGHATLAAAFVVANFYETNLKQVCFHTLSGELEVEKKETLYQMNFPAYDLTPILVTESISKALGVEVVEAYLGRDLVCVLASENEVKRYKPKAKEIEQLPGLLLHITALGTTYDCVSRSFAPKVKISEDPVCGSGHCHIVPLWSDKLMKNQLICYQASERSGTIYSERKNDRILLSGKAILYAISEVQLDIGK